MVNHLKVSRQKDSIQFAREVVIYQGGLVMFWGGIMFGRRRCTPLIFIERTGTIYIENIIEANIQSLRKFYFLVRYC